MTQQNYDEKETRVFFFLYFCYNECQTYFYPQIVISNSDHFLFLFISFHKTKSFMTNNKQAHKSFFLKTNEIRVRHQSKSPVKIYFINCLIFFHFLPFFSPDLCLLMINILFSLYVPVRMFVSIKFLLFDLIFRCLP